MVKKLCVSVCMSIVLVLLVLPVGAVAVTVEQVTAVPPEFSIYLYDAGISAIAVDTVTAYYDGEPMKVTGLEPASRSDVSICYIYALDVSASINRYTFEATKQTILEAYDNLNSNEKMVLITFGDVVETRLTGGEDRAEVARVLGTLAANNMNTDFYGAIKRVIELSKRDSAERKIGIIFSDGLDDIYAGFTRNELYNELLSGGVSLNAMCVSGVSSDAVSQFGEMARLSGGELFLYDTNDVSRVLQTLLLRIDSCYRLRLESASNITDSKTHTISFKLGDMPTETIDIAPTTWIPDDKAPEILSVTYDSANLALVVAFSERVAGASDLGAYDLQDYRGKRIKLVGVSYSENGENPTAVLTFENTPYEGEYTLACSGLNDVSMEKNALDNAPLKITLTTGKREFPVWGYILIVAICLAAVVLVSIFLAKKGKEKNIETEQRINDLEMRPIIAQGVEAGNQIKIPKALGISVTMDIFDGKGKKYSVAQDIVTSLFIGKHSGNDLVIDDSRISRQHAVIEKLESAIAIQDLNSTNGTLLNGARIQPQVSQRIAAGDSITLGDTTIRIVSVDI